MKKGRSVSLRGFKGSQYFVFVEIEILIMRLAQNQFSSNSFLVMMFRSNQGSEIMLVNTAVVNAINKIEEN